MLDPKNNFTGKVYVMKKRILLFSTIAAASVMLCACNDYVGKEKSHPLYVKAGKEKSAGEYKEAARCYEEFLLICPKSSRTHHELGNIYNDYLNDPLRAVYHYRKWMEMNPNDKTNYEDVRLMAETAQKNLFKKLKEEYKDSAETKKQEEELQKLKDQLAQAQNSLKQSEEQNQKMKEMLLSVKAEREKMNAQTIARNKQNQAAAAAAEKKSSAAGADAGEKASASAGKKAAASAAKKSAAPAGGAKGKAPAAAEGKAVTSYKVQPGDTLIKISRKCYGSPRYYHLIAEANRGKIGKNTQVRIGQTLVIPPRPKQ